MVPLRKDRTRKRLAVKAQRAAYANAKWAAWWRTELTGAAGEWDAPSWERSMCRVDASVGWFLVAQSTLRRVVALLGRRDAPSSPEEA